MTTENRPIQPPVSKLTDPRQVQEVYANHVAALRISDDHCYVTLSIVRPPTSGPGSPDENVVCVRLVTPLKTLQGLAHALQDVSTSQVARAVPPGRRN